MAKSLWPIRYGRFVMADPQYCRHTMAAMTLPGYRRHDHARVIATSKAPPLAECQRSQRNREGCKVLIPTIESYPACRRYGGGDNFKKSIVGDILKEALTRNLEQLQHASVYVAECQGEKYVFILDNWSGHSAV
ncbi:hypothetical protein CALVIDRAFT_539376 [Calocera viscosa TUFC12733]|uniref:Uncharacterized protein n=1 Tax=Calocera viscosa (strain TUFC12733) TaxID=1330018 RepID=A0A167JWG8_CALVF|nr:hypothetical protein CALVIDRAFT_539376 [Calocera viscosa TUFC12733]